MSLTSNRLLGGVLVLSAAAAACDSSTLTQGSAPLDGGGGAAGLGVGGSNTGGATAAKTCGERGNGPSTSAGVDGPVNPLRYDGPAIVERSASAYGYNQLVLAYEPTDGSTSALPSHANIGVPPSIVLPPGAKVWLSTSGNPAYKLFDPMPPPSWYVVRDKKDGRIIVAAGKDAPADLFAPLTFLNQKTTCVGAFDDGCGTGTATYSSFDVHGDTTATIEDGHHGMVRMAGLDYDVELMARSLVVDPNKQPTCGDYFGPYQGFAVGVKVKDPAPIVADLEVGAPVACSRGNANLPSVGLQVFNGSTGSAPSSPFFEGKVFFTKLDSDTADCFSFKTATNADATFDVFRFCVSPGLFSAPVVGQEFWAATWSPFMGSLRGPNRGPMLLATGTADLPLESTKRSELERVLGVSVDAKPACRYADGGMYQLWDVTLGTATPVVLRSESRAAVTIDGHGVDAWTWQAGTSIGISLAAR
jgi:hypothetical protein